MRSEKSILVNICLGLMLFALVLSQSACEHVTKVSSDEQPQAQSDKDKDSPLPVSSPEEAKAIVEAADLNNSIGQARWDREIQQAVSDRNNPFNQPGVRNRNNPLPGGMPNPNPQAPIPLPEDPADGAGAADVDENPAPVDRYQDARNFCNQNAAQYHLRWDAVGNKCGCDDTQGYYDFSRQPGILTCEQSIERLALAFQVSHHSGNDVGTNSDIKISICPYENKVKHWNNGVGCKDYTISTVGGKFNEDSYNLVFLNFGDRDVLPLNAVHHITLTLLGRDGVYFNSINVSESVYKNPVVERVKSLDLIIRQEESFQQTFDSMLPPLEGYVNLYANGVVNSWLDDSRGRGTMQLNMEGGLRAHVPGTDRNDEGEISAN